MLKRTEKALDKAKTKDSMQVFKKLTQVVDGEPRIIGDPPLIEPIDQIFQGVRRDQIYEELHKIVRSYRSTLQYDRRVLLEEFRLVDVARKLVKQGVHPAHSRKAERLRTANESANTFQAIAAGNRAASSRTRFEHFS
jgi:coenzyme F420-reducing hydrogenase gamma subunit